jgi:hypothetical protein
MLKHSCVAFLHVVAVIAFFFCISQKTNDQTFDGDFVGIVEGLPAMDDEFGYNSVVLSSAGVGAVFAEVVDFSSDAGVVFGRRS